MQYRILSAALVAFAAVPVAGQTGADSPALSVEISVLPLGSHEWQGIYYAPSGDPSRGCEELFFNPHERSVYSGYQGPAPVQFFRQVPTEKGGFRYMPVGSFDPPDARGRYILLFEPSSPAPGSEFHVFGMGDSQRSFPGNSLVFFNSTGAELHGIFGDQRIVLPAGASAPLDVSGYFDRPAPIGFAVMDGDEVHKVLQNRIAFEPDRRTLMILRAPKEGRRRLRTVRLTEYLGR